MTTGFQGHIERSPCRIFGTLLKSIPFSMQAAITFVPTFTDYPAVFDDHRSHQRIGIHPSPASVCQYPGTIHIFPILCFHIKKALNDFRAYIRIITVTTHDCPASSFIRTITVGTGITPVQSPKGVADYHRQ